MDGFSVASRFLFALEPERAHNLGLGLMKFASKVHAEPTPVRTSFGDIQNPLGLAAGYDKTGGHLKNLERLGFGYIVAGTFTISPWPGNPKPRVARNRDERTLVNSLGFPNPGVEAFVETLSRLRPGVPILGSISGRTSEDVLQCYKIVQPHVAGVEVNLSSPNTPNLRDLREPAAFRELSHELRGAKSKPTYLKTPPFIDEVQFDAVMTLVRRWEELGFEGVTASNTIQIDDPRMAVGKGGMSGPPLLEHTKSAVARIRRSVNQQFEINACGGICRPADALSLLSLGATTIQIFTALVYQGPRLVRDILGDPGLKREVKARSTS
jgi:dihydroorotate dehydrogenase